MTLLPNCWRCTFQGPWVLLIGVVLVGMDLHTEKIVCLFEPAQMVMAPLNLLESREVGTELARKILIIM